ncbi:MAG TPA: 4'-phosphopantetheinyl transferase superfamily protein [Pyrinomonadaceae bacterium]
MTHSEGAGGGAAPDAARGATWRGAPERPRADGAEVHVWRVTPLTRPADEVAALRALLSEDEAARADRFRFERHRGHFIVARAALRRILGRYLGSPGRLLRFGYNEYGKPSLAHPTLRFNLSHAGEVALLAVTSGREVGVDVEAIRDDVEGEKLAEHFFSPGEVETLMSLPEAARARAFFDCWTRKEAFIKALGSGLSHPLDAFDVSLAPGEPAALLRTRADSREAARWTLRELEPGEGYAAAVAVEGGGWELRCWEFG